MKCEQDKKECKLSTTIGSINLFTYRETYFINQDNELLVIGSMYYKKRTSDAIVVNIRDINGNDA